MLCRLSITVLISIVTLHCRVTEVKKTKLPFHYCNTTQLLDSSNIDICYIIKQVKATHNFDDRTIIFNVNDNYKVVDTCHVNNAISQTKYYANLIRLTRSDDDDYFRYRYELYVAYKIVGTVYINPYTFKIDYISKAYGESHNKSH